MSNACEKIASGVPRWTARDPILFGGQQSNLYVYAGNDPVNRTDPSGKIAPILIGAGVGAVVGAAVSGYTAYTANGGNFNGDVGEAILVGAGIGAVTGALTTVGGLGAVALDSSAGLFAVGQGSAAVSVGLDIFGLSSNALTGYEIGRPDISAQHAAQCK